MPVSEQSHFLIELVSDDQFIVGDIGHSRIPMSGSFIFSEVI
jgi:hypothetical protein